MSDDFMKDLVIIGAGGLGREVAQLIMDINQDKKTWNVLGFIDETIEKQGSVINDTAVLGGFDWFEKENRKIYGQYVHLEIQGINIVF